jgi:hypothetical protein
MARRVKFVILITPQLPIKSAGINSNCLVYIPDIRLWDCLDLWALA